MTPNIFAEWLRRQGHEIVRTASSYWHSQGTHSYQAFPYHWLVDPSEEELAELLRQKRAIGLRYSTALEAGVGCASYHAVYEKPAYGFEDLGQWARKNVRRGLRACSVEPIPFQRLAEEGWRLQHDTLDRQRRRVGLTRQEWRRRCLTAADLPGFEAWGALVGGRLAASLITFQMDRCAYLLWQQCHRDYLTRHVNNALSFVVTRTVLSRPNTTSVLYSLHSLDAPPSMDEFKFRMGYAAKPVRQRVVFHPWLAPMFNRVTHSVLKSLTHLWPGNPTLSKAEGMTRFYLEGKRRETEIRRQESEVRSQNVAVCHSERSEESRHLEAATNRNDNTEMLRCAQHDRRKSVREPMAIF